MLCKYVNVPNECAMQDALDYSVRLVGGTSYNGKVEVNIGGVWGTVCSDRFDEDAAKVVCRQLGYRGNSKVDNSYYPGTSTSSSEILLDELICVGSESSLKYCSHNDPRYTDCSYSEEVAVVCDNIAMSPLVIVGAVFGSLAVFFFLVFIARYCKKKARNRPNGRRVSRQDRSPSLRYTVNVQYNNSTGNLHTDQGRVIIPPSSPGIYAGPPRYDQLFPNEIPSATQFTGDSPPPSYPEPTHPVLTEPTAPFTETVCSQSAEPHTAQECSTTTSTESHVHTLL